MHLADEVCIYIRRLIPLRQRICFSASLMGGCSAQISTKSLSEIKIGSAGGVGLMVEYLSTTE